MLRGQIRDEEMARQIRDFSGLRWGKITPTDIDGSIFGVEFGNEIFIFFELKYLNTELPTGQMIYFERLVDVVAATKRALGIIARHDIPPDKIVYVAPLVDFKYRHKGKWNQSKSGETVKNICDRFIKQCRKV